MDRNTRILVVEDEGLVALDLQDKLIRAGYDVPDVATSSDEALLGVATSMPDIVLMDIRLKGQRDGIQTAQEIRDQSHLPVIFITANADPGTLQRASRSLPAGFFVKPIQFASLVSSIEMAVFKARAERYAVWRKGLECTIDDIVFATDTSGSVEFMNETAKRLMGSQEPALAGKPLSGVLSAGNENREDLAAGVLERVNEQGCAPLPPGAFLSAPGSPFKTPVEGEATLHRIGNQAAGVVWKLRDASGLDWNQQQLRAEQRMIAEGHFASGVRETVHALFHLIADRAVPKPLAPVSETEIPETTSLVSQLDLACEMGMGVSEQLAIFTGNQPQPFELIDVNQFIARNAPMFQNFLGNKVTLNISLCSEASILRMPLHTVAQILMNLLISAKRKLTGSGTIHLTTEIVPGVRAHLRIEFRLERAGPAAWTPFGFPFEPEAFDSEISVANAIVASAEGTLLYEQRWANAAHLEVLLPCLESVEQFQSHAPLDKPVLLLVAAGEETARALQQQLNTCGCRIIRSASVPEALIVAQFHRGRISAVLGDVDAVSPRCREQVQRAFLDRNPHTKFVWRTHAWQAFELSREDLCQ